MPAPDLIDRDFAVAEANIRWCGHNTYVKTWRGWAYPATVIDLHSRTVTEHMRT